MALVTRYFSTAAAGAGDGTSWADRAALFDGSGQFSTIITGFNFGSGDALESRVGPGAYDCGQELNAAAFSVAAPTISNPLIFAACDSSGNPWEPPDPGWSAASSSHWDDTDMPIIQARHLITPVFDAIRCMVRGFVFEPQGFNGVALEGIDIAEWCICRGTVANAFGGFNARNLANCWVDAGIATQYSSLIGSSGDTFFSNVRAKGNGTTATAGARTAVSFNGGGEANFDSVVADGTVGVGFNQSNTFNGSRMRLRKCVAYGNGGDGFRWVSSAANGADLAHRCVSVGNGAYGMVSTASSQVTATLNRLRHNTSGNMSLGNRPAFDNIETVGASQAADDAAEFVDAANGDLRIKYGSDLWGLGIGAGDEPAPAGGGGHIMSRVRTGF